MGIASLKIDPRKQKSITPRIKRKGKTHK